MTPQELHQALSNRGISASLQDLGEGDAFVRTIKADLYVDGERITVWATSRKASSPNGKGQTTRHDLTAADFEKIVALAG